LEGLVVTDKEKLHVLKRIAHALNDAHIAWALGSSAFLYLKGLVPTFHDLDLFIAHGQGPQAEALLASLGQEEPANYKPDRYGTKLFCEFTVQGVEVDLMEDFSIIREGQEYFFPLEAKNIVEYLAVEGEPIPIESLASWQERYTLMGRLEKAQIISSFLKSKLS
jgi:hypothetical protein